MFHVLHRQRRRIGLLFVAICIPLWIGVFWTGMDYPYPFSIADYYQNKYFYWLTLAVFALFVTAVNATFLLIPVLFIIFAPRLRGIVEMGCMGVLVGFLVSLVINIVERAWAIETIPSVLWWAIIIAIFYFRLYDKVLPRLTYRAEESYVSQMSIEQLWAQLAPLPGNAAHHWNKGLIDLTEDADDPAKVIAQYEISNTSLRQVMQIRRNEALSHFSYSYTSTIKGKRALGAGTYSIDIRAFDQWRHVTLTDTIEKLPFSQWLAIWASDALGDQVDHLKALETGKRDYSTTGAQMRHTLRRQSRSISPKARPA